MLTKQDKKFLKETFAIKDDLAPIEKDISSLKQDISSLKQDVSSIKKDTSSIHEELTKLRKAEEVSAKYFDTVTTGHTKRLKKIEQHLGLPTPLN